MIKKYLIGLSMAWGQFFYIPCPVRRWDEESRSYMLSWLPTIGLMIGLIWMGVAILLFKFSLPIYLPGFLMTFIPFILSGFIHVDGFMDVCDAVGSWGSVERKREILKDSHVGSSAVIKIIFYVLCYYSMMMTVLSKSLIVYNLILIAVVPRTISALFVMLSRKIGDDVTEVMKSEYVGVKKKGLIFLIVQALIYIGFAIFSGANIIGYALLVLLSVSLGTVLSILYAKKKLRGMNGDIAGFGIMMGELFGMIMMAIL